MKRTHGHTLRNSNGNSVVSPTYRSWVVMRQRLFNPNSTGHHSLVARGITMDPRWHDFVAFLGDMGPRPDGYHLRRKDLNLGFDKSNCYWGPKILPRFLPPGVKPKRRTKSPRRRGRPFDPGSLAGRARERGIALQTVYSRIRAGWSEFMALNTPARTKIAKRDRKAILPTDEAARGSQPLPDLPEYQVSAALERACQAPAAQGSPGEVVPGAAEHAPEPVGTFDPAEFAAAAVILGAPKT